MSDTKIAARPCAVCSRPCLDAAEGLCTVCAPVAALVRSRPAVAAEILRRELGYCVISLLPHTYARACGGINVNQGTAAESPA